MINIRNGKTLKAGLFLVALMVLATSVSAISVDNPGNYDIFGSDFQLNVSDDNTEYDLWHQSPDDSWEQLHDDKKGDQSITTNWDVGTHTLKLNNTSTTDSIDVDYDDSSPTTPDNPYTPSDGSAVSSTSPDVEVKVDKNGPAGLDNIWLKVSGNDNTYTEECKDFDDSNPRTCSFNPDLTDGEQYDVDWNATDEVGNEGSGSWSFSVDTTYNGDESPELSWSEDETDGYIKMDDDVDLTVTLESSDSDDVDEDAADLICYDGDVDDSDNEFDTDSFNENDDDELEAECTVEEDGDYLDDSELDLSLGLCDSAGNCVGSDEGEVNFDKNAPIVAGLETASGASTFNSDFKVNFEASDDASGVEEMEYYFSDDTDEDWHEVDFTEGDTSFTVESSNIDDTGSKTLYVRAKDGSGRWSDSETIDFDYYPNEEPEINMNAPVEIEATAGSSQSFDVEITNTGEIFIGSVEVEASSDVYTAAKTVSDLKESETKSASFSFTPGEEDIGKYTLTLNTNSPSRQQKVDLRVKANSDQQKNIEEQFSDIKKDFEGLKTNVTSLGEKVSGERETRLMSNFSKVNNSISEAERALENGEYYKVESVVNSFDSNYSQAAESYEAVKKEYKKSRTMKFALLGVGALIILSLSGVGGLVYTGKINSEMLEELGMKGAVEDIKYKVESATSGEDEDVEEFEWNGFDDN